MSDNNKIDQNDTRTWPDPAAAGQAIEPVIAKKIGEEEKGLVTKIKQEEKGLAPILDRLPSPTLDAALNPNIADGIDSEKEKKVFVTTGEKIHKWSTYLGVDWIFNASVGAAFAHWGNYNEFGKKIWKENLTKGFTKLLEPVLKGKQLEYSVGKGNMFMSIIAGGMFTIPPLMILEHNKVKKSIVESLDNRIYGKEKLAADEQIQQAHEEIANAPKKDFLSGNSSRFAALAPLLALVLIPKSRDFLQEHLFDRIAKGTKWAFNKVGATPEKLFKNMPEAERQERWHFIHNGALGMDLGFGIPYAILHEFFYRKFAGNKARKKQEAEAAAEITAPVSAQSQPEPTAVSEPEQKKFTDKISPANKLSIQPSSFIEKAQLNSDLAPSNTVH